MRLEDLSHDVIRWANDKGIIHSANTHKQALKMVEEVGEVCRAVLRDDRPEIIDGIGDVAVTIIILAAQYGYDIEYCLQTAYDVIKDRSGQTIDGTFIKSEDIK